jgi:hypothetical protein
MESVSVVFEYNFFVSRRCPSAVYYSERRVWDTGFCTSLDSSTKSIALVPTDWAELNELLPEEGHKTDLRDVGLC